MAEPRAHADDLKREAASELRLATDAGPANAFAIGTDADVDADDIRPPRLKQKRVQRIFENKLTQLLFSLANIHRMKSTKTNDFLKELSKIPC